MSGNFHCLLSCRLCTPVCGINILSDINAVIMKYIGTQRHLQVSVWGAVHVPTHITNHWRSNPWKQQFRITKWFIYSISLSWLWDGAVLTFSNGNQVIKFTQQHKEEKGKRGTLIINGVLHMIYISRWNSKLAQYSCNACPTSLVLSVHILKVYCSISWV